MSLIVFICEFFAFLFLGKLALDRLTPGFNDDAAVKNGNEAIRIRRFGILVGLSVAILGAFIGTKTGDILLDATQVALYGVTSIGFMIGSIFLSDLLLSKGLQNQELIKADNKAVAITEAGTAIAIGLIVFAGVAFDGSWMSALIYFGLGIGMFATMVFIFNKRSEINFADLIEGKANEVAAYYYSYTSAAYALIVLGAIAGPSFSEYAIGKPILATLVGYVVLSSISWAFESKVLENKNLPQAIENQDSKINALSIARVAIAALIAIATFWFIA